MGGMTGVLIYAFAMLALGILLPWYLSFDFLDAMVLLAYACLPALLVAPVVAESFAGDRERAQVPATLEERRQLMSAKVAAGALYGWSSALLAMIIPAVVIAAGTHQVTFAPLPSAPAAGATGASVRGAQLAATGVPETASSVGYS